MFPKEQRTNVIHKTTLICYVSMWEVHNLNLVSWRLLQVPPKADGLIRAKEQYLKIKLASRSLLQKIHIWNLSDLLPCPFTSCPYCWLCFQIFQNLLLGHSWNKNFIFPVRKSLAPINIQLSIKPFFFPLAYCSEGVVLFSRKCFANLTFVKWYVCHLVQVTVDVFIIGREWMNSSSWCTIYTIHT